MLHRKISRLDPSSYLGHGIYFVTVCCDQRRPYLANTETATTVRTVLLSLATKHVFALHAYCLMPDHIHILAEGRESTANALEFIRHFKQQTGFAFKRQYAKALWEFSFYDHILRPSDEIIEVARYIWWNPVRTGLCASPGDYLFSGSQTLDWMQQCNQGSSWLRPWSRKGKEKARV